MTDQDNEQTGLIFVHNDMGPGFTHFSSPECGCAPHSFPDWMTSDEIMEKMSENRDNNNPQLKEIPRKDILETLEHEIEMMRNPPPQYVVAEDGGRMVVQPEPDVGLAEFYEELSAEIARLRYSVIDLLRLHMAHHNAPEHSKARGLLPDDWRARI